MGLFGVIKDKISGKDKTQGYTNTIRSHVIGEEKKPYKPKAPSQRQPGAEAGRRFSRSGGEERKPKPRTPRGPGPEEMSAAGKNMSMGKPEPSLEPMPLKRQGAAPGPEKEMRQGGPPALQPKAVEKPIGQKPKPPSVPGGNKQDVILDEVRFLKSELSAIKSQIDAVNERLKNVQREKQRRY